MSSPALRWTLEVDIGDLLRFNNAMNDSKVADIYLRDTCFRHNPRGRQRGKNNDHLTGRAAIVNGCYSPGSGPYLIRFVRASCLKSDITFRLRRELRPEK